ncbi:aldehyde dehydrogenase family protein [Actinoplanes palleronii]|nr:aldehyde dehydrogenase family protein [Actinoplanes palleronii]
MIEQNHDLGAGGETALHWIAGSWLGSGSVDESVNPSNGQVLGTFDVGGLEQAKLAVAAARDVFDNTDWAMTPEVRSRALTEMADRLEARKHEVALMLARENGKRLVETTWEVGSAATMLRHSAASALVHTNGRATSSTPGMLIDSQPVARGVAGIITPWNSPVYLTIRAVGPALAAGCTVVVKMPVQTALTNNLLAQVLAESSTLPAGAVNIFTEPHRGGAVHLVESTDVDVISYTGSTNVGRAIAASCAAALKPALLELGGKTPLVVFEDAGLAVAVPTILTALTLMNGQFCCTGSRILVHRDVADEVRDRLRDAIGAVRLGPAEEPTSELGPVVDQASVERLEKIVADATTYADVIVRGGPVTDGPLEGGAFFRPTLLEVDDSDVPIVQEEVFGPVQVMEVFEDEADAIRRANATEFGLAAAVFTQDRARARRVGHAIQAGGMWLNTWGRLTDEFETTGWKQSGLGMVGPHGVEAFQKIKVYAEGLAGHA